jgi:hypothetical protein
MVNDQGDRVTLESSDRAFFEYTFKVRPTQSLRCVLKGVNPGRFDCIVSTVGVSALITNRQQPVKLEIRR